MERIKRIRIYLLACTFTLRKWHEMSASEDRVFFLSSPLAMTLEASRRGGGTSLKKYSGQNGDRLIKRFKLVVSTQLWHDGLLLNIKLINVQFCSVHGGFWDNHHYVAALLIFKITAFQDNIIEVIRCNFVSITNCVCYHIHSFTAIKRKT
jgi:hypothetical protein